VKVQEIESIWLMLYVAAVERLGKKGFVSVYALAEREEKE